MDKPHNPRRPDKHADELASSEVRDPSTQPGVADPDPFSDFSDFEISLLEGADLAGAGIPEDEDNEWFLTSLSTDREPEPLDSQEADEDIVLWHVPTDEDEEELPFERYMRSFGGEAAETSESDFAWDSSSYSAWEDAPGSWSIDEFDSQPSMVFRFEEPEAEPMVAESHQIEEPEAEPMGIGAEVNASDQSDAERRFVGTGGPADMPEVEASPRRSRLERAFQVLRRTALLASDTDAVRDELFEIVDRSESALGEEPGPDKVPAAAAPSASEPADRANSEPVVPAAAAPLTIPIGQARESSHEPLLTSTSLAVDYRSAQPEENDEAARSTFFTEMTAKNEAFSNTMEIDARKLESYTVQWQATHEQTHRPEAKPEVAAPPSATVVTAEPKRRWLRKKRGQRR